MKILAIETTGKYESAAIISEDGRIYSAESHDVNEHLREIIHTIDEVMTEAGCSKQDLTHVAASIGPGSFTGIRIGVTAARTIAQCLGLPCIGISSLKAMALRVLEEASALDCDVVAPIINARRHQVYAGAWKLTDEGVEPLLEERQYMIEELLELLKSGNSIYFTGDGVDAYEDIISESDASGRFKTAPLDLRYQHASTVAGLALAAAAAGQNLQYDELLPEYMRLAEAEQNLKAGTLSDKIREIGI